MALQVVREAIHWIFTRKMDFCPSLYKWGYLAPGSGEGLYLSNILLRNVKPVYGRNQKIQRQWTKFWSKLRLFCHHFPPLIVAKYLSTMSQWESKSWREIWNWAPGEIRKFDFSTFLNNFKMTIRKVTPTATKVNEKKFWRVPHLKWHVVSSIWGFSWP